MRRARGCLFLFGLLLLSPSPASADVGPVDPVTIAARPAERPDRPFVEDELVVGWKTPERVAVAGAIDPFDFFEVERIRDGRVSLIRSRRPLAPGVLEEIAAKLRQHSEVAWVDFNNLVFFEQSAPPVDDPKYPEQWALQRIDVQQAWHHGHGARRVVVAVVDTGVHIGHEDLQGQIWMNPCEDLATPNGKVDPGLDDNEIDDACEGEPGGNGHPDDFHG